MLKKDNSYCKSFIHSTIAVDQRMNPQKTKNLQNQFQVGQRILPWKPLFGNSSLQILTGYSLRFLAAIWMVYYTRSSLRSHLSQKFLNIWRNRKTERKEKDVAVLQIGIMMASPSRKKFPTRKTWATEPCNHHTCVVGHTSLYHINTILR